jgi:4-carboxymuconolactone decarboxylase
METLMTVPSPARIPPATPPYPLAVQQFFDRIMPKGMEPLVLFRTLAQSERVLGKTRDGGLLDPGHVSMRQREIVIDRTCARCGCEYEWGVHTAIFAERVGFTAAQKRALLHGTADDPAWPAEEGLLVALCDELHDGAGISDALWTGLAAAFTPQQILELIALAGFYHTISYLCNGLRLPLERFAPRMADMA